MHCLRLYCVCVLGGVIHSIGDSQDIRFMGGLSVYIPFTPTSLIASNFALCGMPFYFGNVFYKIREFVWGFFFFFIVCVYEFNGLLFFPRCSVVRTLPVLLEYTFSPLQTRKVYRCYAGTYTC